MLNFKTLKVQSGKYYLLLFLFSRIHLMNLSEIPYMRKYIHQAQARIQKFMIVLKKFICIVFLATDLPGTSTNVTEMMEMVSPSVSAYQMSLGLSGHDERQSIIFHDQLSGWINFIFPCPLFACGNSLTEQHTKSYVERHFH